MRTFILRSLFLLTCVGCSPGQLSDMEPWALTSRSVAVASDDALEEKLLADSCSGTVLVAEGKPCVPHPNWSARRLFAEENRGAGRLDTYCVFEWEGDGIPARHQYPHADEPHPPEPDCLAASGMGKSLQPRLGPAELEARFLEHVRASPALPLASNPLAQPVLVSVVDTAREIGDPGQPGAGNSPHGRAMGLVISRLACPEDDADSTCAARIDNVPALRMVRTPAGLGRDPNGGYWAYLNDMAWGIGLAVARRPPGRHQVINLSVGWSTDLGDLTRLRPHVRAVYDALRYARCLGALAIVAAGNTNGERAAPEGPLVPAAWQSVAAPTAAECQQDFGLPGTRGGAGSLVFAVSAVDRFDRPLTTTPVGARATLAAPGLQVLVQDDNPPAGPPPVGPQTGSSGAAATASALAAIAWTYYPELLPVDVMQKLADAGVELDATADFCFPPAPCPKVRRLSACQLIQRACDDGRCSPAPICDPDEPRGQPLEPDRRLPLTCAETRAPLGCAEDPPGIFTNRRLLPLGDPQPDENPCGSSCDLGASASSPVAGARAAAPSAAPGALLHLVLPINPNLSHLAFTAYRLWIRDDATPTEGWLQIDLRKRLPHDQPGGSTLTLDLDPAAEGIVGQVNSAQVDFYYEDRTMDGTVVPRMVGSPISVPASPAGP
jgi:hypothetical protein